jgi:hypothetical protein
MPFAMHAKVRHGAWGQGMVMSRERDRITVLFEEVVYKTLSLEAVEREGVLDAGQSSAFIAIPTMDQVLSLAWTVSGLSGRQSRV